MNPETRLLLQRLIIDSQYASLGTLQASAPYVSMVPYAAASDFSAYFFHISRLAVHTANLLADPRASLMIIAPGIDGQDPQTLARISLEGRTRPLPPEADQFLAAKTSYLVKYPQAEFNFSLDDFSLFAFQPARARFIAGFGRILDLDERDIRGIGGRSG